jgi:hypothetical protein
MRMRAWLVVVGLGLAVVGCGGSNGDGGPAPAAGPGPDPSTFVVVQRFSGARFAKTPLFAITVGEWRIRWEVRDPDTIGSVSIPVHDEADDFLNLAANHQGEGGDTSYIHEPPGRFSLSINAANLAWRVFVEVPG